MPVFRYQAYDSDGAAVEGEVDAAGKDDALAALQAQQLWVKKIQVRDSGELSKSIFSNSRVTLSELRFLTAELAMLLKNGVRIDRGLAILLRNADSVAKKRLLGSLVSSVRGGQSLSSAISEFPETFSPLYINLVKIGEQTGSLAPVFDRLSNDLNFQAALRAKITEALTYPLVILTVCIISIAFVFNYIVPQMGGLFEGLSELPFYTEHQ